jgi:predicted nucleotidyltransferase
MTETFRLNPDTLGPLWPALDVIRSACTEAGVSYLIIGAAARDLLLEHVYGARPLRATRDVDAAVSVRSWDEYEAVIDQLVQKHEFERTREPHRVRRADLLLDVVPFGDIADAAGRIEWPGGTTAMSVLGFGDVHAAAVGIAVGDGPPIPVASLAGIGVLKLVAWGEAPHRRAQDPVDLCAIMTGYHEALGERLFIEHADLFDAEDFDLRVASSRAYGRHVAALLQTPEVRAAVLETLHANTRSDEDSPLTLAMGNACDPSFPFRLRCLRAFVRGVEEHLSESD